MSENNGAAVASAEVTLVLTRQELATMLQIAEETILPAAQTKMIVASFQVKAMAAMGAEL